jgi:hypothetical protein
MVDEVLSFKPSDEEKDYLKCNNISWSRYCHDNLKKDINNSRYTYLTAIANNLLILAVGAVIGLIGMAVISDTIVIVSIFVLSGVLCTYSFVSMVGVFIYKRF